MAHWFRRDDAPEPPLLDQEFLARLGRHIGMAETRELVADGMLELADRLDALERHAGAGAVDEVASLCHEIAGAAGHLGLTRLSLAAVDGVRRCRGGAEERADDIVAPVLEARAGSIEAAARFCRVPDPSPPAGAAEQTRE